MIRRAASYSDFYRVVRAQLSKDEAHKKKQTAKKDRQWDALMLCEGSGGHQARDEEADFALNISLDEQLLEASQEDYLCVPRFAASISMLILERLYRDQLTLTERHLDGLVDDANATLKLLTTLSNSFKSVESQTSSFQSQCEDLLREQKRLEKLADDVGTDLHYYAFLDTATRRLNAPGASRLVDDDAFSEMVENIDACIVFMNKHVSLSDRLECDQSSLPIGDLPRPRQLSC